MTIITLKSRLMMMVRKVVVLKMMTRKVLTMKMMKVALMVVVCLPWPDSPLFEAKSRH